MPAPYFEREVRVLRATAPVGKGGTQAADLAARRALVRFYTLYPWTRPALIGLVAIIALALAVWLFEWAVSGRDQLGLGWLAVHVLASLACSALVVWQLHRKKALLAEELAKPSLICPACGYDVRGLREPTCPECGGALPAE